jgi:hypothetical protein
MLVAATAVLAAATAAAISTPASASAIVTRQTFTYSFSDPPLADDCHPGATGTDVVNGTINLQRVETADGFHVTGTDVASGRIDWSNGGYTIIGSTDRFAVNVPAGTTVYTDAHTDFGDDYSAEGVFRFHFTGHGIEHITMTNGAITRVTFERDHGHIFGFDCSA